MALDRKAYHEKYYQDHEEEKKKYREDHKEYYRKYGREFHRRLRIKSFSHYGNRCLCCGETRYEFLVIDHINGGGNRHRKEIGKGGEIYYWLKKNNYPEGFQVLCHNCNMAKGAYGECPHKHNAIEDYSI